MAEHILKVVAPYFDALLDGSKTFEVRRNDRAFQRGDTLILWEHDGKTTGCQRFPCESCKPRHVERLITFVYSGDPRFKGIEPGHVVLALAPAVGDERGGSR